MAAPAQRLPHNCSTDPKSVSSDSAETGPNLQNGGSMEDLNQEDMSGNVMLNNRGKPRQNNCGSTNRDMKMDNFQDGGPQLSGRPNAASNPADHLGFSHDRTRLNSEYPNYNQNSRDPMMLPDEYRNSQEPSNHGSSYGTAGFQQDRYVNEQHGGLSAGAADVQTMSSQQKQQMYSQYQRAGFPNSPRPMNVGPPPRANTPGMGLSNYPNSQQRFIGISQQGGGPTPTLNQLLQAPNPLQRFQNSYGEYNSNQVMHKDQSHAPHSQYSGSANSPHGWSPTRGPVPYQQQMLGYRGQQNAPQSSSGDPSIKRPPYMGSGGPPSSSSGPSPSGSQGAPSPVSSPQQGQQASQYGQQQQQPYPSRPYPQSQGSMGSQRSPMGQSYNSQQMGGSPYGLSGSGSSSSGPANSQSSSNYESRASSNSQQQQFGLQQGGNSSSQNQSPQQENSNAALDELSSDSNSNSGGGLSGSGPRSSTPRGTPPAQSGPSATPSTPTSQQNQPASGAQGARPVPSPSGSSGSRSMSPAIGQQQSIPMPPRPSSSSQSDNAGATTMNQATTPLGTSGYNSQMAPPPMYGNKMASNMLGNSAQLGPYSPQSSHYPPGNYRQNSLMMPSYGPGGQGQNNYGSPSPTGQSGYPPSVIGNRIPNHSGSPIPPQNFGGYHNSQYGASGGGGSYGMNNMMPPPSQYPKSPGLNSGGAAQAAAQAAVFAAAASSSATLRSSTMYVRHHLQQKMYGGNYNNLHAQAPGASNHGPGMAPPSGPGLHPMGMPPGSSPGMPCQPDGLPLVPPTVSTPSSTQAPGSMSENSDSNINSQTSSASSMGNSSTSVTQSISSPVPSASMMVSSPSMASMSDMPPQGPQMSNQPSIVMGPQGGPPTSSSRLSGSQSLPPPHVLDEASQASNASASSSLPDDRSETPKPNKPQMSHPPTPNTLPSPGAASMSSFHDEFESVSSPSWPRTPASPVVNNQGYDHHPIKRPDGLLKLYEISEDPDRRNFLDKLIIYSEERGTPISQCPTISKQPLDLYRLYASVKERGGFVDVTKSKQWKEVAGLLGIGASSSAAYTLRKQYIKHILPYECKYDRGGIDPQPIINQVENTSRKKGKNQQGSEVFPPPSSHSLDGYPQGGYPSPYGTGPPAGPHPSLMMNSDYPPPPSSGPPHMGPYQPGPPSHHPQGPPPGPHLHGQAPNHLGPSASGPTARAPEGIRGPDGMLSTDPYSEEMPPSQYQRHTATENYGYNQTSGTSNSNSMMPTAYSSTQSSMSGGTFGYSGASTHQPEPQYNSASGTSTGTSVPSEPYPHHVSAEPGFTGSRSIAQDPYNLPPGSYPPNRTIGGLPNSTQYPYQGQYEQERYESGNAARPTSQPGPALVGPSPAAPAQSEIPVYPAQQRYGPSQSIPVPVARDPVSPQAAPPASNVFPGRSSAMPPSPYSGGISTPPGQAAGGPPVPYPQGPPDGYSRVPSDGYQNSVPTSRLQTMLAQRLLTKNNSTQKAVLIQQGYPPQPQPTAYTGANVPPNKVAPPGSQRDSYQRDMYLSGPKRHPDFMKAGMTPQDQYPPAAGYPPPQPAQAYPDRSQYPYRSGHMGMPPPTSGPGQPAWGRDSQGRTYPTNSQGQYPMSRETWDQSRALEGQQGNSPWSGNRYGPIAEPYQNCGTTGSMPRGMKISPHSRDRPMYMQQNKMSSYPTMSQAPQAYVPPPQKKELVFPPDTVEGARPVTVKRRKLQAKDVSPLEAWRLMMALKSGLLAESTWALDVLSVLLYDDNTVLYFGLNHLPGLLEAIMEHYRRCLNVIFNLAEDIEICAELRKVLKDEEAAKNQVNSRPWYIAEREWSCNSKGNLGSVKSIDPCDKTVFLSGENFSFKTRCNKVVRCRTAETLFLIDPDKKWDCDEGFTSGGDHWQLGGGDLTSYIQTHFENSHKYTKFARVMETVKKEKTSNDDESDDKSFGDDNKRENEEQESKTTTIVVPNNIFDTISLGLNLNRVSNEVTEIEPSKKPEDLLVVKQELVPVDESIEDEKAENPKELENKEVVEQEEESEQAVEEKPAPLRDLTYPKKRKRLLNQPVKGFSLEGLEEESYNRDEPSLCNLTPAQDSLARRCICLSSLLRNLSFVPGNDSEMAKHAGFLLIMGRLLLLKHTHSPKKPPQRHFEREQPDGDTSSRDADSSALGTTNTADSCSSLQGEKEWWWDMLHHIRENTMVVLANISGHLDLTPYPEEISLPILDGLLHWAVCPSSYAQDPLPNLPTYSVLSPQRLSLEALCKLSTMECNIDLVLATPPWSRMEKLFSFLSRSLGKNEDQVLREFAVVLLSNLSQADTGVARAVALQGACISQLLTFVEQAEQSALQVANSQGINALRENPELMGTTLDMVRRSAATLRCLAMVPENRPLFLQHQQRLLTLVMSQILDQGVASIVADVLYECSRQRADSPKSKYYTESTTVPMIGT